jgi:hypothetical protein
LAIIFYNIRRGGEKTVPKKSKKSMKGRPTTLISIILILVVTNAATVYYFMFVQEVVPAENVPMAISNVIGNISEYIGKPVTLLGYYVYAAGHHMLVSNPMSFFNNSLMSSNHVILTGTIPSGINTTLGRQISVKCVPEIREEQDVEDPRDPYGGAIDSFFDISYDIPITYTGEYIDVQMNPYEEFSDIPTLFDPTAEKYAVLYSGGMIPSKAFSRYWNDLIYMYFILQMHGYPEENIYVVYKDGVGEDTYTPVHYPATHASMDAVFDILSAEMGARDTLYFYSTNHGGSGGIYTWGPMDSSTFLTHSQVANWLDSITCNNMIVVMEQCVSGAFVPYLSAPNRVIITACTDSEGSWACDDEGNWDEFVYHFMCALVEIAWNNDGSEIQADRNNDSLISMREAFIWAAAMDSRPETPWYNDNGDGDGYHVMEIFWGSWYGDTVFL